MPLPGPEVELSADQVALLGAVREYARRELLPLDRACDASEESVCRALPELGAMGLLNLVIPESLGGLDTDSRTYASIIHDVAYASPSVAVTLSVHNMVGKIVCEMASDPLRSELAAQWAMPEHLGAFALSEAEAGSDARSAKASAERVEGGFRVSGEKMWITNGLSARWFLSLVRLAGAEKGKEQALLAVMIDGNDPGVTRTKIQGKMGIRGSETAVIHYDGVFVPDSHVIGAPGEGLKVFLTTLNEGRISIAAQASGIAEACLDDMVSYARQRQQFDRPIGKLQAIQNMIADSAVELAASKLLIWRAASLVDAGESSRSASSMAKLYASEAGNRIAYRAVQVHGGAGYVSECRVEQLYRDVRVTSIYEGTSEIQRLLIGRGLGKQAANSS